MGKLQSSQHGPFLGVDASAGAFVNPQGTVPRASNLISIQRGSLATCDGSAVLAWHSGQIQSGDSKIIALSVFQPTGVSPYYLALKPTSFFLMGPGFNTVATPGSTVIPGSTLTGTHTYQITSLDGIGGESKPTPPVTATAANGSIKLTWNGIPNAFGYNIYRDGQLLTTAQGVGTPCGGPPAAPGAAPNPTATATLPILQTCGIDAAGNQSYQFAYIDTGAAVALAPITVTRADTLVNQAGVVQFTVASTANLPPGQAFTVSGLTDANGNAILNGTYIITNIVSPTAFQAVPVSTIPAPPVIIPPPPPPPPTAPTITTINPSSGVAGNTVTITGSNFGAVQAGTVTFNGLTASTTSWSNTSIVATVPTGVTTGPVVVTVGSQSSNGFTFTVAGTVVGTTIALASIVGGITIPGGPYNGQPGLSLTLQKPWSPSIPLAVGNTVTVSGTGVYDGARIVAGLSPGPDPYGMTLVAVTSNTVIVLNQGQVTLP